MQVDFYGRSKSSWDPSAAFSLKKAHCIFTKTFYRDAPSLGVIQPPILVSAVSLPQSSRISLKKRRQDKSDALAEMDRSWPHMCASSKGFLDESTGCQVCLDPVKLPCWLKLKWLKS